MDIRYARGGRKNGSRKNGGKNYSIYCEERRREESRRLQRSDADA